jgi:hypothetical protein
VRRASVDVHPSPFEFNFTFEVLVLSARRGEPAQAKPNPAAGLCYRAPIDRLYG